ncbi:MAG: hypothetical protein COA82_02390 [Alkaliphilus sp.]|nr:MAG: hypothetical protein COA82_02390 [Alkaliphilus sp.]
MSGLTDYLFIFSIHAFSGMLLVIFGYLIKVKRKGSIINGYKESNYKDSDKYLDCIGTTLFLFGFIFIFVAFSVFVVRLPEWVHAGILVAIFVCLIVSAFHCERKFRV